MKRVTQGGDINFNTNEISGLATNYTIRFYTANTNIYLEKTNSNAEDGYIALNWSELSILGGGVLHYTVDNEVSDPEYSDGEYNRTFSGTTKYYIDLPFSSGGDADIDALSARLNSEISRSTAKDNEHDSALANVYTKQEVDDILSDIDNVQSDWNVSDSASSAFIKNKPTNVSDFINDAGYLTNYTETDPTVPSWAKQPTKPTYTASEVGALPNTTVIPTVDSSLSGSTQTNAVQGGVIYTALQEKVGYSYFVTLNDMTSSSVDNGTIGYVEEDLEFYIYDELNDEWKPLNQNTDGSCEGKQYRLLEVNFDNDLELTDETGHVLSLSEKFNLFMDDTQEVVLHYNSLYFRMTVLDRETDGYEDGQGYLWGNFVSVEKHESNGILHTINIDSDYYGEESVDSYFSGSYESVILNTSASYANFLGVVSGSSIAFTTTVSDYRLKNGNTVTLRFNNHNIANATLNVSNTGAKSIYYNNRKIRSGEILPYDIVTFYYYSNGYHIINILRSNSGVFNANTSAIDTINKKAVYNIYNFGYHFLNDYYMNTLADYSVDINLIPYDSRSEPKIVLDFTSQFFSNQQVNFKQTVYWEIDEPPFAHLGDDINRIIVTLYKNLQDATFCGSYKVWNN